MSDDCEILWPWFIQKSIITQRLKWVHVIVWRHVCSLPYFLDPNYLFSEKNTGELFHLACLLSSLLFFLHFTVPLSLPPFSVVGSQCYSYNDMYPKNTKHIFVFRIFKTQYKQHQRTFQTGLWCSLFFGSICRWISFTGIWGQN